MTEPKKAQSAVPAQADPLAAVEGMIRDLERMRERERDKALRGAYVAAVDRLHALAHWLGQPRPGGIVGAPARQPAAPAPAAAPQPQAALPLGPVIVRARKPKPR